MNINTTRSTNDESRHNFNDGGPAFPVHGGHHPDDDPRNHTLGGGMTLRDWFAGQALAAMSGKHMEDMIAHIEEYGEAPLSARTIAYAAYDIADAMLADREACK